MLTVLEILSILSESKDEIKVTIPEKYQRISKDNQNKDLFIKSNEKYLQFSGLKFNSKRANISINLIQKGFVNIPDNVYDLPNEYEVKRFNSFTIVKDSKIVVPEIIAILPDNIVKMFNNLDDNVLTELSNNEYKITLSGRKILEKTTLPNDKNFFVNFIFLLKLKSKLKVLNTLKNEYFQEELTEQELFLKKFGISKSGYYSFYENKQKQGIVNNYTEILLKGINSNIPSLYDVLSKVNNKDSKLEELEEELEILEKRKYGELSIDEQIKNDLNITKIKKKIEKKLKDTKKVKLNFVEISIFEVYQKFKIFVANKDKSKLQEKIKELEDVMKITQKLLDLKVLYMLCNNDFNNKLFLENKVEFSGYEFNLKLDLKNVVEVI